MKLAREEKRGPGFSILHLLEELVGGVLIAILLHSGQVALLWCHSCIDLKPQTEQKAHVKKSGTLCVYC